MKDKLASNNTSGFLGVSKSGLKWKAQLSVKSKIKYLGVYSDPRIAARRYDIAVARHLGKDAATNLSLGLYEKYEHDPSVLQCNGVLVTTGIARYGSKISNRFEINSLDLVAVLYGDEKFVAITNNPLRKVKRHNYIWEPSC